MNMMIARRIGLLVGASWLSLLSGCSSETSCTEIGCRDTITVSVAESLVAADGEYELVVEAPSVTSSCTITTSGGESTMECPDSASEVTPNALEVVINFAPSTLDTTSAVTAIVSLAGAPVGEVEEVPNYTSSSPNGEDCPPTCLQGSVELQ